MNIEETSGYFFKMLKKKHWSQSSVACKSGVKVGPVNLGVIEVKQGLKPLSHLINSFAPHMYATL